MADTKVERYKAKHAFGVMYEGEQITIHAGEIVRAGHPLLNGLEEHFELVESLGRWDVDAAPVTPKPKRARKPRAERTAQAEPVAPPAEPVVEDPHEEPATVDGDE